MISVVAAAAVPFALVVAAALDNPVAAKTPLEVPPNVTTPPEADAVAVSQVPANCRGGGLAATDELAAAAEDDDALMSSRLLQRWKPMTLGAVPNAGALAEAPNENPEDAGAVA